LDHLAVHRPLRAAGRSKNNFAALFSFALSGLASSSRNLLRLPFHATCLPASPPARPPACAH
jgi:hypothetical protein